MNYQELKGECKNCGGCIRLESKEFAGTNECEYADDPIKVIKEILGVQERIKI